MTNAQPTVNCTLGSVAENLCQNGLVTSVGKTLTARAPAVLICQNHEPRWFALRASYLGISTALTD